MKENKGVFYTLIVLLCIFLPLTIFGVVVNKRESIKESKMINPKHELYYDNAVWFYKGNKLLSSYKCVTKGCKLAQNEMNDDDYKVKYYTEGSNDTIELQINKYAFIKDGDEIVLYDVSTSTKLTTYSTIKNYGTKVSGNRLIIENNKGKWGVLGFPGLLENVIPFDYDFIALPNKINDKNELESSSYVVNKDNKWFIVNDRNEVQSAKFDDTVVDFNNNYIITMKNSTYKVYNYNAVEYFQTQTINDYAMVDNNIVIIVANKGYLYTNPSGVFVKDFEINKTYNTISMEKNNNSINILLDGIVLNSVEIN